jgi:hypothetical protein
VRRCLCRTINLTSPLNHSTGCFATYNHNYTLEGNFTGNLSKGLYGFTHPDFPGEEDRSSYLHGSVGNITLMRFAKCCLNGNDTAFFNGASRRLQEIFTPEDGNATVLSCTPTETVTEAIQFHFENEEEDLVRSHWENFQHPKPTVLYENLAQNMREEIRSNFIRTQTVKYEHDVVRESLHNETTRVKTLLDEKRNQNRRKMDLLFARHKNRVMGLHQQSANVLDHLESKRRDTSDTLADLKEDHLATVAALNQNAREVDEHLRVKTEEHMDAMTNYYQRWHDNHEDAEETILNLRRSNGRVGEGIEDAAEFYFGNPEPLFNDTEVEVSDVSCGACAVQMVHRSHQQRAHGGSLGVSCSLGSAAGLWIS